MDKDLIKFKALPDELVHGIFEYLNDRELARVALTCSWGYQRAMPLLWKDLELKDKWTLHPKHLKPQISANRCRDEACDEHDDTPVIKNKPHIASLVHTVLHRCHLPTPSIYQELPKISFKSKVLSTDVRTRKLLMLAMWNLTNVHTLRIVYGHYNLTHVLVWGFLHPHRPRNIPLRRLWLENCSLAMPRPTKIDGGHWPDLTGMESLRVRRLTIVDDKTRGVLHDAIAPSRGKKCTTMQDGVGGEYRTYTTPIGRDGEVSLETLKKAIFCENLIYKEMPEAEKVLKKQEILFYTTEGVFPSHDPAPPVNFLRYLLWDTTQTLTSLNLDMLLTFSCHQERDESDTHDLLNHLSALRFPHLRAFQMRNAATPWSSLPKGTYLLDAREFASDFRTLSTSFLEFMEAHDKLQCLAWPMDRFFSQHSQHKAIVERRERVLDNLSRTLTELRIDISFSEDPMDEGMAAFQSSVGAIARRRRFISWFASRMKKVEVVKMEGAIPRAERREIIRALHASPLKKIVMIGTAYPLGNTWANSDNQTEADIWGLHFEDEKAISATNKEPSTYPGPDFEFNPSFDWPNSCSMAHTIASFHSQTITELKFCGYTGAPILFTPTPPAKMLLEPLRHFHALERLTMSFWLDTYFEGDHRDLEVISYWLNMRSPQSTALAVAPDANKPIDTYDFCSNIFDGSPRYLTDSEAEDDYIPNKVPRRTRHPDHVLNAITVDPLTGPEPLVGIPITCVHRGFNAKPVPLSKWPDRLHALYLPRHLAEAVARQIAPLLSDTAKRKAGGVLVRASFCLGAQAGLGAVWDVDVRIGAKPRSSMRIRREKRQWDRRELNGRPHPKGKEKRHVDQWFDVLLDWDGPREEAERSRWWGKMKERRWF
ncbi:uncharacterized protein J3D65DRAFT_667712 [Phyllosticta citribraziliensis]|uniref:F-box domain-containing protein n=1 Tax=Phyllosticta citribraziliensis TaxID=989973 RepID=A0ABR1LPA7_9PEZI